MFTSLVKPIGFWAIAVTLVFSLTSVTGNTHDLDAVESESLHNECEYTKLMNFYNRCMKIQLAQGGNFGSSHYRCLKVMNHLRHP